MAKKTELPIGLMIVIMLILMVVVYWIYKPKNNTLIQITPAVTQEQVINPTETSQASLPEHSLSTTTDDHSLASDGGAANAPNSSGSLGPNPNSLGNNGSLNGIPQNQSPEQGDSAAQSTGSSNADKTDEQIAEDIRIENLKREAAQKAVAYRQEQMKKVHDAIMSEGVSNEVKPFVPPSLTPPDDIAEKLRSNEYVGH